MRDDTRSSGAGEPEGAVTRRLREWSSGDDSALGSLMEEVYDELRRLARRQLAHEPAGHTLQPTALVHEVYLRLAAGRGRSFPSRAHFFAFAARLMRHLLVDHARARRAGKRGGGATRMDLPEDLAAASREPLDVLAVDAALRRLEDLDARQAQVVELRCFAGLTVPEAADVLGVSSATVDRDWQVARRWLACELTRGCGEPG